MTWTALKKRPAGGLVDMTMSAKGGHVFVYFGRDALEALGCTKGDKVRAEVGSGDDAGFLRITKSSDGFSLNPVSGNPNRLRIKVWAWEDVARAEQSAVKVEYRRTGVGMIDIRLPPWAFTSHAAATAMPIRRRA